MSSLQRRMLCYAAAVILYAIVRAQGISAIKAVLIVTMPLCVLAESFRERR